MLAGPNQTPPDRPDGTPSGGSVGLSKAATTTTTTPGAKGPALTPKPPVKQNTQGSKISAFHIALMIGGAVVLFMISRAMKGGK